ncbi:MAG TPA: hypothetical protein PLU52_00985 [Opitutaceae bacterium]|nr:hypothetical protein [Opitutaceae bacterium]HND60877.1 hypothetical protein [Opitutaceae bacterium]
MQIAPLPILDTNPTCMDRRIDIIDRLEVDGTQLDEVLVEMTRMTAMLEIERLLREVGEVLGREV